MKKIILDFYYIEDLLIFEMINEAGECYFVGCKDEAVQSLR
jgi:hypothetical protein